MNQEVNWGGYKFIVYSPNTNWNDVAGVYIFAGLKQGRWMPLYIGETESFSDRLPNHERWAEAYRAGATHVHAMVVSHEQQRKNIEAELIERYQPSLNMQHK